MVLSLARTLLGARVPEATLAALSAGDEALLAEAEAQLAVEWPLPDGLENLIGGGSRGRAWLRDRVISKHWRKAASKGVFGRVLETGLRSSVEVATKIGRYARLVMSGRLRAGILSDRGRAARRRSKIRHALDELDERSRGDETRIPEES